MEVTLLHVIIAALVAGVGGFVAGLLVGRRNPAIANEAASVGNAAVTVASAAKSAVTNKTP